MGQGVPLHYYWPHIHVAQLPRQYLIFFLAQGSEKVFMAVLCEGKAICIVYLLVLYGFKV